MTTTYIKKYTPLFEIPLISLEWTNTEQLNQDLTDIILKKKETNPGIQISNVGGWHSEQDLLDWDAPCIKELKKMIDAIMKEMLLKIEGTIPESYLANWQIEAWANVNIKGSSNKAHDHTRDENQ